MLSEDSQLVFFGSKSSATSISFDLAHRSLRAAEIQIDRIWGIPSVSRNPEQMAAANQDILIDVHFYFVALRNVYRWLEKIVADEVFKGLRSGLDEMNDKWFRHYGEGREAFEHIDQRLPGQKHESKIVEIEENGARRKINYGLSMRQGIFRHSDGEWDISKAAFGDIKNDVDELLRSIVEICRVGPSK